jgi:serine phosphatase RsbU (regulator of sigma subunit)
MFITAQLAIFDCQGGEIRVASAGHPPLLLASPTGEVTEISAGGPPLGVGSGDSFPECSHPWQAGCALMFTDGLIEACNAQGELLGVETIKNALAAGARAGESSAAIQLSLVRVLEEFERQQAPADDTAFLVICKHPEPSK